MSTSAGQTHSQFPLKCKVLTWSISPVLACKSFWLLWLDRFSKMWNVGVVILESVLAVGFFQWNFCSENFLLLVVDVGWKTRWRKNADGAGWSCKWILILWLVSWTTSQNDAGRLVFNVWHCGELHFLKTNMMIVMEKLTKLKMSLVSCLLKMVMTCSQRCQFSGGFFLGLFCEDFLR